MSSWSPSEARFLPALRPDQSSPNTAALRGRPTPVGAQSHHLPFAAITKHDEASAGGQAGDARPSQAPKLQSRSQQDGVEIQTPPSTKPQGPSTTCGSTPGPLTGQPFFSLTEQELKQLRRKMGKGPGYKNFRDLTVARSLNQLGRGWEGFLLAKHKAEKDDAITQFWQNFGSEITTILSTAQFPVGALSLEIAASAAQSNYTETTSRLQPEYEAEIQRLKLDFRPSGLPNMGLAGPGSSSLDSHATVANVPSHSTVVHQGGPQLSQPQDPEPILYSRPKRILNRPNYMELPFLESSLEPPSSPQLSPQTAAPTPRELYDSVQPKFIHYPCEWQGCKAILHNLETLRKHLRIVHWRPDEAQDAFCCRWGICGTEFPRTFKATKDLENHSEIAHLTPLECRAAW